MSKRIDELKDWAMHNVKLISILPSNKNLPVDTKLTDVLEHDVDEKYFLSDERVEKLNFNVKRDSDIKQIAQYDTEKRINANAFRVYDPTGISPTLNTMQGGNLEPCVRVEGVADRTRCGKKTLEPNGKEYANALTSVQHDSMVLEKPELRIRKLTSLECWRLQGFTDEQFYKAKNDGVSDSQLYKQAGNSVTVNVIDAIARKLI